MSANMHNGYLRKAFVDRGDVLFMAAMLWMIPNGWGVPFEPLKFDFTPA